MQFLMNKTDPLPYPKDTDADVIAVSQHLTSERMIEGYGIGLFPWNDHDDEPVNWWSPRIRGVFLPDNFHTSRSFARFLRKTTYRITFDSSFQAVVRGCASRDKTWITPNMFKCYGELFDIGVSHSVEVWDAGLLVGGIFGIGIGRIFIGESMFSTATNASKLALKVLLNRLKDSQFLLLDTQMPTPHLHSLGCLSVSRDEYLKLLKMNQLSVCTVPGKWRPGDSRRGWKWLDPSHSSQ